MTMTATLYPLLDLSAYEPDAWREHARCIGVPLSVFFPEPTGPTCFDAARVYCASCPVIDDCREDALANRALTSEGFRGGMTPRERAKRPRRKLHQRVCNICRTEFESPSHRPPAMYCSDDCRNQARNLRMRKFRKAVQG